jgi:hypothetical protein
MKKAPPPLWRRWDFLFAEAGFIWSTAIVFSDGGNPVCEIPNSKFQIPSSLELSDGNEKAASRQRRDVFYLQ